MTERLGRSGLQVSRLCLGTMMFGAWGDTDERECRAIVDTALDAGITFVDCADIYDYGVAETMLGKALGARRDDVVLATKFGNPMSSDPGMRGASRRWIERAVDDSLRRLGTDHIDVYQLHRPDPDTPLAETIGALDDLVHAGKIGAYGTSTFPAEQLVHAAWIAERDGAGGFASEQPPYSIFARGIEAAVLPVCQELDLGVLVWAPLNAGWLTGKYRRGAPVPPNSRGVRQADHFDLGSPDAERKLDIVEGLATLADECGMTMTHLAIAFTLAHPAVTSAIVGPRSVAQLTGMLGADRHRLDDDVLDRIDALVAPGVNLNQLNAGYTPPALSEPRLRRR